jgi:chromosome segregation ATPase
MDIKAQLRKYKIQLSEIRHNQDLALQKEKQIYAAETARIETKKQDHREDCQSKADNLKQEQMNLMEDLAQVQSQLLAVDMELGELHGNKFKLREEVLLRIHAENKARKEIRRNKQIFIAQINGIQVEIATKQKVITGYETARRYINEDYYNWKAEIAETEERISVLQESDKKRAILMAYLEELRDDIRSKPEKRYEDLDKQKIQTEQEIQLLDYQCNKLTTYMNKFNTTPEHQELIVSSYLRDKQARIPELTNRRKELTAQIAAKRTQIDEYDTRITNQLNSDYPAELLIQEARANQRLQIATSRTESEYKTLIDKLSGQIHDLEYELVQQIEADNNKSIEIPIYHTNTTVPSVPAYPTKAQEIPVDMKGKSRKEIERLEKQRVLVMQQEQIPE